MGGPPVAAAPPRRGFGSRVLDGTIRGQLGGTVCPAWEPAGLVRAIAIPLNQHQAEPEVTAADAFAAK